MYRTTFWLAAALSSVPAEGGRGLRGVRTRRAETPTNPSADVAPAMWYSVEYEAGKRYCRYDSHYPPQFLDGSAAPGMLFDDRDGCCAAHPGACPDAEATAVGGGEDLVLSSVDPTSVTMPTPEVFGDVTTAAATMTTTAAPPVPRWYPVDLSGHRTCVYGADYDPAFLTAHATFLFDGRDECCDAFQACQTVRPTSSPTGRPARWFPHTYEDGRHACAHGTFYPDEMAEEPFSDTFLHDTEEACCEGFPAACRHDDVWRWIPNHSGDDCAHVELPPSMLREDHSWIFRTREACCEEHPCAPGEKEEDKAVTTTEAPATTTEEPEIITDPTELTTEAPETTTMVTTTEAPETTTTTTTTEAPTTPDPDATTAAAENVHCEMGYDPVCGHDGLAYGSGCDAVAFGTGIACPLDAGLDIEAGSPCACPDTGRDYETSAPTPFPTRGAETAAKEPMWYSVEYEAGKRYCRYDAHYPAQFLTMMSRGEDGYLFGTRDGCCAAYPGACTTTTAVPPTTTTAAPGPMWYPVETKKGRKCRYDADYDPAYLTAHATFLFETKDGCCGAFPEACRTSPPIVMPTTFAPTSRPTGFPTEQPTPATAGRWIANEDGSDCVYTDLPWNMATSGLAHETRDGCCAANSCPGGDADTTTEAPITTEVPITTTTATEIPVTTTAAEQPPMWYPIETDGGSTSCVRDSSYPPSYTSGVLFETRDGCCGAFPAACVTRAPTAQPTTARPTARPTGFPTEQPTPDTAGRWLSNQDGSDCVYADLPWSMANSDLAFETRDGCCAVNACPGESADTTTEAPATATEAPATTTEEATTAAPMTTTEATTTTATTTEAATVTPTDEPGLAYPGCFWHFDISPGQQGKCTNSDLPPGVFEAWSGNPMYMFDTADECCRAKFSPDTGCPLGINDVGCTYASETTTTAAPEVTTGPTEVPGADWPGCKWHMDLSDGAYMGCTNSDDFPSAWEGNPGQMFDTAAACCDKWYGGSCKSIEDVGCSYASGGDGETGTTSTEAPAEPGCMWHMSTTVSGKVCTNDQVYPPSWDYNRSQWFFSTSTECCEVRGGCDNVIDDCPDPNAPEEPEDPSYMKIPGPRTIIDFEGGAMAYIDILAESPGWTMSSDHAYAGDSSMTNVVDDESWGTQSDLVLKVDLANPSTITFRAMIDVGQGYETFALFVDGQQRNTYGQRITGADAEPTWLPVTTSLPPGRHVLSMSVVKAPERPESWPRDLKSEGTGSVWVDEIEIFDTL